MFLSCSKDINPDLDQQEQFQKDLNLIRNYLSDKHIDADSTAEGIFYKIDFSVDTLPDFKPTANSNVTVNYTGYFLDDHIFDAGNNISFPLDRVIKGWQIGLMKLKVGDKARLFIPSKYGYGTQGNSEIPANSVLIFNVELLSID